MKQYNEFLELAKEMHKIEDKWPGMSLVEHLETIDEIIEKHNIDTALDYGCGKAIQYHKENIHESHFYGIMPSLYDPAAGSGSLCQAPASASSHPLLRPAYCKLVPGSATRSPAAARP